MHIIEKLAELPGICIGLSVITFLIAIVTTYGLLDSLMKMHRSKSAVKKIKMEYKFHQKLWLIPFEVNCLHAVKFCKFLIWYQRIGYLCIDVPVLISNGVLSRSIIGRFREYSFEKYHNTKNHNSLL